MSGAGNGGTGAPITGLSHVQLLVADVEASRRWYETVLGMQHLASDAPPAYAVLRHAASGVVVVLSPRHAPHPGSASPLDHLALAVPDGTALEAWAEHLERAGVGHPGVVLELGKPSLQLRDPDGNAIELVAPPGSGRR